MIHHDQRKNTVADVMLKALNKILFIIFVCIGCDKTTEYTDIFSDGLPTPDKTATFDLSDSQYGIEKIDTFFIDINDNGKPDTITRERFVTGTGHAYTTYQMTLDNGIQLANLKTHEGADCILTAYKFYFDPFTIVKASRPLGSDYTEPTKAKLEKFQIKDNKLEMTSEKNHKSICDVRYLL